MSLCSSCRVVWIFYVLFNRLNAYSALGFIMILGCFSSLFFIYLCALLSISFFTLFERKVLACVQKRVGPNKVGVLGVFQPFADALKLFSKEINAPTLSNYKPFIYTPRFALFLSLTL